MLVPIECLRQYPAFMRLARMCGRSHGWPSTSTAAHYSDRRDGITARDSPIRRSSSHTRLRIDEQTKVTDIARPRVCLKSSVRALCTSRERISIIGPLMQRVNSCVLLPRLQKDFPCGLVVHRLPPAASIPGNKEQKSSAPESRSMCIRAVRCSFRTSLPPTSATT